MRMTGSPLAWTHDEIEVGASFEGDYALPYRTLRVVLPEGERRPVKLIQFGSQDEDERSARLVC